jgi:hypothetical protein
MRKIFIVATFAFMSCGLHAAVKTITEIKDTTITPKSDDTLHLRIGQMKIDIYPDSASRMVSEIGLKKPQPNDFAWYGFSGLRYGFLTLQDAEYKIQTSGWLGNTSKRNVSSSFAFNVLNTTWELKKNKFRLCSGIGFQFNSIAFNKEIKLEEIDSLSFTTASVPAYKWSTLNANYIQVPFVFQFNGKIRKDGDDDYTAFHASFGCIGGYLIGSNTFYKWEENGDKKKQRLNGTYGLNPFQADVYVDFGFGDIATWFLQSGFLPVFKENKGPELTTMTFGLKMNF